MSDIDYDYTWEDILLNEEKHRYYDPPTWINKCLEKYGNVFVNNDTYKKFGKKIKDYWKAKNKKIIKETLKKEFRSDKNGVILFLYDKIC